MQTKTEIIDFNIDNRHPRVKQTKAKILVFSNVNKVLRIQQQKQVSSCCSSSGTYLASRTPLLRLRSSRPHLRRAGEQHPGTRALRQSEHVERSLGARLDGLDGVVLVVRRGGWASQVVDLVYFELEEEETTRTTRTTTTTATATETTKDDIKNHLYQTTKIERQKQ